MPIYKTEDPVFWEFHQSVTVAMYPLFQLSFPFPRAQALDLSYSHHSVCVLTLCRSAAASKPHLPQLWLLSKYPWWALGPCLTSEGFWWERRGHLTLHSVLHSTLLLWEDFVWHKEYVMIQSEAFAFGLLYHIPASPTLESEYSFHNYMTMGDWFPSKER